MSDKIVDFPSGRARVPSEIDKNKPNAPVQIDQEARDEAVGRRRPHSNISYDELEQKLRAQKRLSTEDRVLLVRNLGSIIEELSTGSPVKAFNKICEYAYGVEGGQSRAKKRKRFVRFSSDKAPTSMDTLGAHGADFYRLACAAGNLLSGQSALPLEEQSIIRRLCRGTSFSEDAAVSINAEYSPAAAASRAFQNALSTLDLETDVRGYLRICAESSFEFDGNRDEIDQKSLISSRIPFAQITYKGPSYNSLLNLNSFQQAIRLPYLYPGIRLATLFWPRPVLCFDHKDDTERLSEIKSLTIDDFYAAGKTFGEGTTPESALAWWQRHLEHEVYIDCIRRSGFDPAGFEWSLWDKIAKSVGQTAISGMHWRVFFQARSIDLIIGQAGVEGPLDFGFASGNWWTYAPHDVTYIGREFSKQTTAISSADGYFNEWHESYLGSEPESSFQGPISYSVADNPVWLHGYACLGLRRQTYGDNNVHLEGFLDPDVNETPFDDDWITEEQSFGELETPFQQKLIVGGQFSASSDLGRKLQNLELLHVPKIIQCAEDQRNWVRSREYPSGEMTPSLQVHFDNSDGWTPLPENTLGNALVSGLIYGKGENSILEKLKADIERRVKLLSAETTRLKAGYLSSLDS